MAQDKFIIDRIEKSDLQEIKKLQPEGWSDIIPDIEYYIDSDFCSPVKVVTDNKIIGIGASIFYGNSAWLAHIIVDDAHRNKGLGSKIVERLISDLIKNNYNAILLIATDLGEPVYKKFGFEVVTEYKVLKRTSQWKNKPISKNIKPFDEKYRNAIYEIDKYISGEDRKNIISTILDTAMLYTKNEEVLGYYAPGLREGTIIGLTSEAGLALMNLKHATADKAVIPSANQTGIEFLLSNGFEEKSPIKRMALGKRINWKPKHIYSRIGGNFG